MSVSKRRPSVSSSANLPTAEAYWRKRVFHNTYTRQGRVLNIKGWHVKIQHDRARRTFSLKGANRTLAAIEARDLYETIVTRGWDAAVRVHGEADRHSANDRRYWRRRLLLRGPTAGREFSTRIEHSGVSHYFPLGTGNPEEAADKALAIFQTVAAEGWQTANERFSRELTIAFHWASNPVAWTYMTCLTRVGGLLNQLSAKRPERKIFIIEPDPILAATLAWRIDQQKVFSAIAGHPDDILRKSSVAGVHLVLVNQISAGPVLERFNKSKIELPHLVYSVHEDSDQLFKSTPGGAMGYLLKRTPPEKMLEPLQNVTEGEVLTTNQISKNVREYFQNLIGALPASGAIQDVTKLTHREHEILNLLSKGFLDKEIAHSLRISVWTVHGHLKNVFEKMGVHSRTEAAVKYLHK